MKKNNINKVFFLLVLAPFFSSCGINSPTGGSKGDRAAKIFEDRVSQKEADYEEICSLSETVADAYLEEGRSKEYSFWQEKKSFACEMSEKHKNEMDNLKNSMQRTEKALQNIY